LRSILGHFSSKKSQITAARILFADVTGKDDWGWGAVLTITSNLLLPTCYFQPAAVSSAGLLLPEGSIQSSGSN
jgi:hypothetical protein